ncbi:FtsJ domain-containing protein [Favolaschia claudopus]|uniref:FtsJ domain-containing protein n=1 Tax=Favolaschia claudopus TaxID=2862362 RepID=A0AAW0D9X9_9AGAR
MDHVVSLEQSRTLKKLNFLRYQNAGQPSEQAYFHYQRKQADAPDSALQKAWLKSMYRVFEEIDNVLFCVPDFTTFRFLDLGCCPGGFSSYILGKNPTASGVGVSLPEENGGHACLLQEKDLERFELHWADLTLYQLGPVFIDDSSLQDIPFAPGFDLVLIDGHPLRCATGRPDENVYLQGDRLLVSSLILGLASVAVGGTVVLKLSKPERLITAQLIYLLDVLCADVHTWKPVCMHGTRSTFYVVAKAFRLGCQATRWPYFIYNLMNLWVQLSYGGPTGRGRQLLATDFDFIVTNETLKTVYGPRFLQHSEHIWSVQAKCLKGWRKAQASGF